MSTFLSSPKLKFIENALEEKQKNSQRRILSSNNLTSIDFTSNDYLGLSQHPLLKERTIAFTEQYGCGAQSSRLLSGNLPCHQALEEKLAALIDCESVLLMNSGFQANVSVLPALANRHSLIIMDRLSHNSLLQGALLSSATIWRYRHQDLDHMESLLQKGRANSYARVFVVTESLFGMDGDKTDLVKFYGLCEQYNAITYVDEAHAMGLFGEKGMGLVNASLNADLVLKTFGKGMGSFGACLSGSRLLIDYLINHCSGLIYATALPPPLLGAMDAALDLVFAMLDERQVLQDRASCLRNRLQKMEYKTGLSNSHLIPLLMGTETNALDLAQYLEKKGIVAMAIRPPTIPLGQSRIRLSLRLSHTNDEIEALLVALDQYSGHRYG